MNFSEYLTVYDERKRQSGTTVSAEEFYPMCVRRCDRRAPSRRAYGLWKTQMDAEVVWIRDRRPYVKIYPTYLDSFRNARLDVPMCYLKPPLEVFAIQLPAYSRDGLKSLLVREAARGDAMGIISITALRMYQGNIERDINIMYPDPTEQDKTFEQCLDENPIFTETGTPESILRAHGCIREASRIALSAILLLNGGNRMVSDGSTPIQPDVLTDDLDRFVNGDKATRERLANRARRRGKNGWTIGREVPLPRNRTPYEPSGYMRGPLSYQGFRCGHFRMQACGRRWQDSRLIFVPPTIVRPDLPLPPQYRQAYRVSRVSQEYASTTDIKETAK